MYERGGIVEAEEQIAISLKKCQPSAILGGAMSYDLLIAIGISVLALSVLWLRTNIALGILSLTAGYVVSDLVSDDIFNLLYKNGLDDASLPVMSMISIAIILLPSLLLIFRFKNYQPGRFIVHIAPATAYGLLAMLFILISLPIETQAVLKEESFAYTQFIYFEAVIVVSAVIIAIFDLMAHEKKLRRRSKRHGRSRSND